MTDKRCGTCKWLRVAPDKAGRRIPRKGKSYLCEFQVEWPLLPVSIRAFAIAKLPTPGFVESDDGILCPVWEAHKK